MKEYIERAMAFAVLVDFPGELSPENIGLAVARKAIDALPAADVAAIPWLGILAEQSKASPPLTLRRWCAVKIANITRTQKPTRRGF